MPRLLLALILALSAVSVTAQDIKPSPDIDPKAINLINPDPPRPAQPAPYTEVEALKIQNVQLEGTIVQRAVEDWRKKVAALKAELESKRVGWKWLPETGEWKQQQPEVKK